MKRFSTAVSLAAFLFILPFQALAQNNQAVPNGSPTTAINFPGDGCIYTWFNNTPAIGLPANGKGDIASFTAINNGDRPLTATITATPSPNYFAYIANSGSNNVSVINTLSHQLVKNIEVGSSPFGVSVSPDGRRVYVSNQNSGSVSVIDPATNTVVSTIGVGASPSSLVVSPDGSRVYVESIKDGNISVINTATNTVASTIVTNSPLGIAISPDGKWLYVTSNDQQRILSVISTANNTVTATVPVGGYSVGVAVSPDGSRVYVTSNINSTVTVINTATNAIITIINVGGNPYGLAVSRDGNRVYVANSSSRSLSVINTATNKIIASISTNGYPYGVSVSPDGSEVYAANQSPGGVTVINTNTNSVVTNIATGNDPISLGNFFSPGAGCNGNPVTFTITVNPTSLLPLITPGGVAGFISACYGSPSGVDYLQHFTVSGTGLTDDITITAPPNFEISLNAANGYANTIILTRSGGSLSVTTVYVRSSGSAPPGSISGNVKLASPGAADQVAAVNGFVNTLPTIDAVTSQTVINGNAAAPTNFTGAANGFSWTNDTPGIGLAASGSGNIPAFTAINTGAGAVTATITVTPLLFGVKNGGGETGPNDGSSLADRTGCNGIPVMFTIIVLPGSPPENIIIPNTFTPNEDGVNDVWTIKALSQYPGCTVSVFTRYGGLIYRSKGYPKPWDGTYNGSQVPAGTYYYIIYPQIGKAPLAGFVTIIR